MNNEDKDATLLFHEIPLYENSAKKSPPEKLFVAEGVEHIEEIDGITFPETGGGVTVKTGDLTRVLCWRIQGNTLELFEYSLDLDLRSNHFLIVFEDSKLLPSLHVSLVGNNRLRIVCCTVHAAHCINLDISSAGRKQDIKPGQTYPSLLMSLPSFDFENSRSNYAYGHQIQGIGNNFSAGTMLSGASGTVIGLMTGTANIVLIAMPDKGQPSHMIINQTSRMSRLWSGINPWAGSSGSDSVADLKIVELQDQVFLAAVFKDFKFRMWNCLTQEMSAMYDLHDHIPNSNQEDNQSNDFKIVTNGETKLASIYVGVADQAHFLQVKLELNENKNRVDIQFYSLLTTPLASQNLPHRHLIDYFISGSDHLVTLWHDVEDVDSVTVARSNVGIWHDVAMYPSTTGEVVLQPFQDVREAFMDFLFTPGRFSPLAISRALSMHRRSGRTAGSDQYTRQDLKERVSAHILQEIQNEAPEEEEAEEIDDDMQERIWNTFLQTCVQYQQVLSRSLGLTVDLSQTDEQPLVSVIKKGYVSVLTHVSSLEAVCRGSDPSILHGILQNEDYTQQNLEDLSKLIECLGNLHELLGLDLLNSIEQSLCLGGNDPQDIIDEIMPEILDLTREFLESSSPNNLLVAVDDVTSAIKMLLICLEPADFGADFDAPAVKRWPLGSNGIEILAHCTQLHIKNRFQLTTLLYVLASILDTLQRQSSMMPQDDDIQLSSRVTSYLQAYQAIHWLSLVETQTVSPSTLENTMQTLSVQEMGESRYPGSKGYSALSMLAQSHHVTILEFFLSTDGGKLLQAYLKAPRNTGQQTNTPEYLSTPYTHSAFSPKVVPALANYIMYLMWPLGPTLVLPDFLLSNGHHAVLKRYLQRNLGSWCNWCPKSRAYMLAHCHLKFGDFDKAVRSFILAASGIGTEDYLVNKLLREDEDNLHPIAQEIIYYTQVIQIFEKLDLPEQVIALAQHAIQVAKAQEHDPNLPTLWSSIFRQSNYLSRHFDAFRAIVLNPDPDHRKDCLRALAVSLCERSHYKTLIEFQYGDLEDDLVSILEHRARGTDLALATHNYYDLLYAFYVHRGNYRRAASAMYEQGYRLGCEFSSATSAMMANLGNLRRQLACLVTCVNCLHLVLPDNRWILHPVSTQKSDTTLTQHLGSKSPKRQYDGEETTKQKARNVVIKELPDIQKESMLIETRIKLAEISKNSVQSATGPLITSSEMVTFLCHTGLYDDAILVCMKFSLPLTTIFESLASKCVHLSYADEKESTEAWEWLQENETAKIHCSRGKNNNTAADEAYRLLQVYLEKHGDVKSKGTSYYHTVAKSLLSLSAKLPAWFVNAYKEYNCPELLRLLVCYDLLEEATSVAVELIDTARMKIGTNVYRNKRYAGTWLPYTVIEQLLSILEDLRMQESYDELYIWLNDTLDEYLHVAETVSEDMLLPAR